jgi:hypothetical protein
MSRIPVLIALAIVAVTAAGCGSTPATPGVAQVATTTTTTTMSSLSGDPPSGSSKEDSAVQYSACMRANGVPKFPDPKPVSGGGMSLSLGPGIGDPESPRFKAAEKACEKLLPGGKDGGNKAMDAKARTQMLQFSACMRSHGVPNFPDPIFSRGGARLGLSKKDSLNPRSPVFQAAQKACQKELPDGPKGPGPAVGSAGGTSDAP